MTADALIVCGVQGSYSENPTECGDGGPLRFTRPIGNPNPVFAQIPRSEHYPVVLGQYMLVLVARPRHPVLINGPHGQFIVGSESFESSTCTMVNSYALILAIATLGRASPVRRQSQHLSPYDVGF